MSRTHPKDFDSATSAGNKTGQPSISASSYPIQPSSHQVTPQAQTVPSNTSPGTSATADSDNRWKIATAIFCLIAIISIIGWAITYRQRNHARTEASNYSLNASSASNRIYQLEDSLNQLQNTLTQEKNKRTQIAENWPLTVTKINLTSSGQPVQAIYWEVELNNNFAGDKTLAGELYIKYIRPDGSVMGGPSSPFGYTASESVNVSYTTTANGGWRYISGSYVSGTYRVQFWWDGRIIGEKSITVY